MPEGQRHLTHPGRCQIHALRKSGLSDGAIARQLGRDRTTVWREVRRNPGERACRHARAQRRSEARRRAAPSVPSRMTPEPVALVEGRLAEGWSPARVAGRLRKEGRPVAGRQWTCRHVQADRRAGGGLWRHLRRRGRRPNRRGGAHAGRGHIPERPALVEGRLAEGWSPARVAGRLRKEGRPVAGRQWTCRHVQADRRAGGGLWRHLRRRGRRPNRRGGAHAGRGHIPERPALVEGRARVGDREADTNQRQGHRRGRGVAGGQGVEIHAPAEARQQDRGRGRRGHDAHAGLPSRPHGHGRQRQGVRGPRPRLGGAGRGFPVRAALPLVGARPDRAHQRW